MLFGSEQKTDHRMTGYLLASGPVSEICSEMVAQPKDGGASPTARRSRLAGSRKQR